jgi:hypothetical protein
MKMATPFLLALLLLAIPCRIQAQAPANDDFASARILTGATVSTTGDNTDATLETGEVDPEGIGGASVWFSWTAPATGWHTVHTSSTTPGNGLDTVIALFTGGTSASNAVMLGHNDESVRFPGDFPSAVYPDEFGPSRLVFQAIAGTTYRIAVHGFFGSTGAFEMHIAPEPTPEFIVSSATFVPATVDITGGPLATTASLQILTQNPFDNADVSLFRASNGSEFGFNFLSALDRTAGTPTNGTYKCDFTITDYESPGQWPVRIGSYSNMLNFSLEWSSQGNDLTEDDYLIPQSPAVLTVQNTGTIDTTAPEISSLTLSPASFNLATGSADLELQIDFTDDLSGLDYLVVRLIGDDASETILNVNLEWITLTSGDANDGRITLPITIEAGLIPPGTYDIEVELGDTTFNVRYYGPSDESLPPGSTTTFVNTATIPANDNFANRITLGPALPVTTAGSTVYATMQSGESDLNGVAGASVWYRWIAPANGWTRVSASTTGSNRPVFAIFTGASLVSLQEQGRSDNVASSGGAPGPLVFQATAGTTYHIAVYGFAFGETTSSGNFSLTLESIAQPAARITGFSITPSSVDVATGPQNVTVQVTLATDTAFTSGSYMTAYMTPAANTASGNGTVSVYISHLQRIAGTDTNGTYQATLALPGWYEPGLWNLVVDVSHAGFTTWSPGGSNIVGDKFLIPQSGGQVNLTNSGAIDSAGPVLVSLSGLPTFADVTDPVPVTLDLTITDDASGFTTGQIYLKVSNGSSMTSYGMGGFGVAQRTSGTATSGTYRVTFNLTNALIEGEYSLQINLNDAALDSSGYGGYLGSDFPAGSNHEVTISYGPAGGYLSWAALQNFGPSGLDGVLEDANQDGTENLVCYAFNLPPLPFAAPMPAGGTSGLPLITVVGEGANRRLRIEYLRRRGASGLTYLPQFCSNPASSGPDGWQTATTPPPVIIDDDWERVVVEDAVTGASTRFGRVTVEYSGAP